MHERAWLLLPAVLYLLVSSEAFAVEPPKSSDQRVRDYVSAFNNREIETMLSMVTDDIQWLTVAGDKILVETQGKAQLREGMASYFQSTPGARSELQWVQASESRVAALERATWQGKSGPKSQASLCIYEFSDGLITRVYYFPVEK